MSNSDATPRSALFRLAAAVSIAEYVKHDTRPEDGMAKFCYQPSECEVCGQPTMPSSVYCSEYHRKIVEGK